jgi:hypothetical protein
MLIAEDADQYRIIGQTEHANQVGRIADHWGNDTFDVPPPRVPTITAAYTHDNGWWEWDLAPELRDGDPVNLLEVAKSEWTAFYDRGIDNAVSIDRYAGLLVSMHGAGVRRQRYGTQPELPSFTDEYADFIADEERRQRQLVAEMRDSEQYGDHVGESTARSLRTVHEAGSLDGGPVALWQQYKLLQAWDRLSLYCCLDEELTAETITPVPSGPDADVELSLDPVDETTVRIDPYPFETSPLSVPVRCRTIPRQAYDDRSELTEAYYTAGQDLVPVSFRR